MLPYLCNRNCWLGRYAIKHHYSKYDFSVIIKKTLCYNGDI